ncbi:MAG: sortase [Ardenticatenia bacterium]|nr:sortase [Ardenticatenia bacterium]
MTAAAKLLRRVALALRRRIGLLLLGLGLLLGLYSLLVAGARWRLNVRLPQARPAVERPAPTVGVVPPTGAAPAAGVALSVEALLATAGVPARLPSATPDLMSQPGPVPDWIRIPSLGVDSPVLPVGWTDPDQAEDGSVEWRTADFGAGLHAGSARLGEAGNTVISGHNNIAGAVFRRLAELKPGDDVFLSAAGQDWTYTVERRFIVPEEGASDARRRANARWIDSSPDERVTLVSCYPPWGNSHRVIVVARPKATASAAATATSMP